MQRRALGLQMRRHSFVNHNHTPLGFMHLEAEAYARLNRETA
jgi:hypothetical protein